MVEFFGFDVDEVKIQVFHTVFGLTFEVENWVLAPDRLQVPLFLLDHDFLLAKLELIRVHFIGQGRSHDVIGHFLLAYRPAFALERQTLVWRAVNRDVGVIDMLQLKLA